MCVKPDDGPKNHTAQDPQPTSRRWGCTPKVETGVEKLKKSRMRDMAEGGMKSQTGRTGRRRREWSRRYTEQRGCGVCHIRTLGSVWNLSCFLCYFQSLARAAPQALVTKYGPEAIVLLKQTTLPLWESLLLFTSTEPNRLQLILPSSYSSSVGTWPHKKGVIWWMKLDHLFFFNHIFIWSQAVFYDGAQKQKREKHCIWMYGCGVKAV